jgi:hypothetical protein
MTVEILLNLVRIRRSDRCEQNKFRLEPFILIPLHLAHTTGVGNSLWLLELAPLPISGEGLG